VRLQAAKVLITLLAALPMPVLAAAQTNGTSKSDAHRTGEQTPQPSAGAKITKFYIAEAARGSGYETGPLYIIYSDGTHFIQKLPPLRKSTDKDTVFNAVGISEVQLADDRQTLGWAVQVENCCTSYSVPLSVVVFRSGRVIHSFDSGQMVWNWMFLHGGNQLAVVWGPTHGPEVGDYRLYDVKTGKLVSEVYGDEASQALKADAPEWAKRLEEQFHGGGRN
jgi:hypothetical protein